MHLFKSLFLAAALVAIPFTCFATEYKGSDLACFNSGFQTGCLLKSTPTHLGDLSYSPAATFDRIGNGPVKLGTFRMSTNTDLLLAGTFDLDVSFLLPAGTAGTGTYDAGLLGSVIRVPFVGPIGGVAIRFDDPTTQLFSYPGGSFTLSVPDNLITIGPGDHFDLYGTIAESQTATPEPSAILLLGGGLGLVGAWRLKRFRKS